MTEKVQKARKQRKQQISVRLAASLFSRLSTLASNENRSFSCVLERMAEMGLMTTTLPEGPSIEGVLAHVGQLKVPLDANVMDRILRVAPYDDRTPENMTIHLIKRGLRELELEMKEQRSVSGLMDGSRPQP